MMKGINNNQSLPQLPDASVAVVVTRWNTQVVDAMFDAAVAAVKSCGVSDDNLQTLRVPGAFELPIVCHRLAASGRFDAIIALGCVIRGGTPHFDYVCNAATDGLLRVSLDHNLPLGFGVLTCDNDQQALDRAKPGADDNKGREAALAAMETLQVLRKTGV